MIDPGPETSSFDTAALPAFRWRRPPRSRPRGRLAGPDLRPLLRLLAPLLLVTAPAGVGILGAPAGADPE